MAGTLDDISESIGNRRWSNSVKQEILNSRINTTRSIVNAINDGTMNPKKDMLRIAAK